MATVLCLAMLAPALAFAQDKHAAGDTYTDALNAIESRGMLDTLKPARHMTIKDIKTANGQVVVTIMKGDTPTVLFFDPLTNKVKSENGEGQ